MTYLFGLLENWVHTAAASALGWTLLHSVWEGALVALLLAGALLFLRSGRARYTAACLAMLALLLAFGLTFARVLPQQRIQPAPAAPILPPAPAPGADSARRNSIRFDTADYLPWLAPFWIAGVVLFQLQGLAGWLSARRLRGTGVCAAPEGWESRLVVLAQHLRISRPVRLLESCLTEVPVVIGYLRPVILMPVGLLAGLPASQVESILLHELAHIRRHDYLVNLLQIFVESLVFYHPAVWWISSVIRAERENCCDDSVVAAQGDAFGYAAALVALEQNRGAAREIVPAATGGNLMKRVRRLLVPPEGPRATLTPIFSAALLTVTAAALLAPWLIAHAQAAPQTPQAAAAPASEPSPYRKWLTEDVAYIVTNEERTAFKKLRTREEFEQFIEQFWLRRDPTPGTVENEFKEEHYRRIAYANDHFSMAGFAGWKTDRGRVYITYGPPDEKEIHPDAIPPNEQWLYHYLEGVGTNIIVEFTDPNHTGEFRMTSDPGPTQAAGATVQRLGAGATLISVPLTVYGNHRVSINGRVLTPARRVATTFEDLIQGPAPLYTRIVALPAGVYHLEITTKDVTDGSQRGDRLDFTVK